MKNCFTLNSIHYKDGIRIISNLRLDSIVHCNLIGIMLLIFRRKYTVCYSYVVLFDLGCSHIAIVSSLLKFTKIFIFMLFAMNFLERFYKTPEDIWYCQISVAHLAIDKKEGMFSVKIPRTKSVPYHQYFISTHLTTSPN